MALPTSVPGLKTSNFLWLESKPAGSVHGAVLAAPEFGAHRLLVELADRGARQFGAEIDVLWCLDASDPGLAVRNDCFLAWHIGRVGNYQHGHRFAPLLVGNADC